MLPALIIFISQYLIFFLVLITILYFLKQPDSKKKKIVFFSLIALPLVYVIAKISSYFYYDPRPFVVNHFTPLVSHAPDNGFPSDHTLLGSAISLIVFCFNRKIGFLLVLLSLAIGISRVFAGVHHYADIIGSIVISAIIIVPLYHLVFPYIVKKLEE